MTITGSLARAARALIQLSRADVAVAASLPETALRNFEVGAATLSDSELKALRKALEAGGSNFLPQSKAGGPGVRLKFTDGDVEAIDRLEDEGGPAAEDDV